MNNKELIFYYGFKVKKLDGFNTTIVVSTKDSYVVTDKIYGRYKSKKTYDDCTGLLFTDEYKKFFVYAKGTTDELFTDEEKNIIFNEIRRLTGVDQVEWYYYQQNNSDKCLWPIFKNFNDMHAELSSFLDNVYTITKLDNIDTVPYDKSDHKHIVVKKTFDTEYYKLGSPYTLCLKNHPCCNKLRHPKQTWTTAILGNISDDELTFIIVEPAEINRPSITFNIVLSINEVEEYNIDILRSYNEFETREMFQSLVDSHKESQRKIVGESRIVSLPITSYENKIIESQNTENCADEIESQNRLCPVMESSIDVSNYTFTANDTTVSILVKQENGYEFSHDNFIDIIRHMLNRGDKCMFEMHMVRRDGYEIIDNDGSLTDEFNTKIIIRDIDENIIKYKHVIDSSSEDVSILSVSDLLRSCKSLSLTLVN